MLLKKRFFIAFVALLLGSRIVAETIELTIEGKVFSLKLNQSNILQLEDGTTLTVIVTPGSNWEMKEYSGNYFNFSAPESYRFNFSKDNAGLYTARCTPEPDELIFITEMSQDKYKQSFLYQATRENVSLKYEGQNITLKDGNVLSGRLFKERRGNITFNLYMYAKEHDDIITVAFFSLKEESPHTTLMNQILGSLTFSQ